MPRVLLLHTGGTLAMRGEPLEPDTFAEAVTETVPEIQKLAELDSLTICNLDSSDVGPEHWTELAETIAEHRESHDGFVIIHGTDTMAYTASALSFALPGLDRPVVLTGAQRPLAELRTDARRNLIDAVELATHDIPEVGICFDGLFLRGCRTTKSNVHDYRAFDSPGVEPLARLGVDVEISEHVRQPSGEFRVDPRFDDRVLVLAITPGIRPQLLQKVVEDTEPHGIVLVAFGVGTVPTRSRPIAPVVRDAVESGIEVVVITQSAGQVDLGLYQNSRALQSAGAIPGGCMRLEAVVTKLMHALAIHDAGDARRAYLVSDVAGERT